MKQVEIDLVFDFVCPWCFIGLRNLKSVATTWSDKFDLSLTFSPYFVNAVGSFTEEEIENGKLFRAYLKDTGASEEKIKQRIYPTPKDIDEYKNSEVFKIAQDADIFLPAGSETRANNRIYHPGKSLWLISYLQQQTVLKLSTLELLTICDKIFHIYHIENKNIGSIEVLISAVSSELSGKNQEEVAELMKAVKKVVDAPDFSSQLVSLAEEAKANKKRESGVPQLRFDSVVVSGAQGTKKIYQAIQQASV